MWQEKCAANFDSHQRQWDSASECSQAPRRAHWFTLVLVLPHFSNNKQGIIQIGSAATTAAPFAAFGNSDTFPDMYSTCPRVRIRRLEWSWEKQLRTSWASSTYSCSPDHRHPSCEHLPRQLLLARAGLDRLDDRRYVKCGIIGFKLIYRKERLPGHLTAYAEVWLGSVPERTSSMNSRSQSNSTALRLPRPQTEILKSSPFYHCFTILNSIPIENLSSLAYLSTYLENSRQTSII